MRKYLILTLIACLAVFVVTSPSLSRLPGELVLPERSTAPNATTNTNKIYNLNDETTIVDEDGNTLTLSPGDGIEVDSSVSVQWRQSSSISTTSSTSASSPYPLFLNGSSPIIVTVNSGITNHPGFEWDLSGVNSGDSIYCLGNVSFDGVGDASQKSGVTLVSMTAPWDITIVYRGDANSGACFFVREHTGTMAVEQ